VAATKRLDLGLREPTGGVLPDRFEETISGAGPAIDR
jgi:hypothetical protein